VPDAEPMRAPKWAAPISFVLALIGLGISTYLTIEHYRGNKSLSCPASAHINCLKVTTSSQSEIFGHIPVAVTGLAYYVAMVLLCSPWAWRFADRRVVWLRLAAAISGLGMVIYLVFAEAVQIKAICLWCTGVHAVTFLLFLTILAAYLLRPLDPVEA
jgi:uncharacterized membrane protein